MKSYQIYLPERAKDPNYETDCIDYSQDGIEKWALWSETFQDWIDVPLFALKAQWPAKFEYMESMLKQLAKQKDGE